MLKIIKKFFKQSNMLEINLVEKTSEFSSFYDSVFGNRQKYWRDGPDIGSLLKLQESEKKLAEEFLLKNLDKNDPFIFECLGVLRSRKAEKYLLDVLERLNYRLIPSCGLALWRINKKPHPIKKIGELIKHLDEFIKIDAVVSLGQIEANEAKDYLTQALYDSSYLVRYNALRYLSNCLTDTKQLERISKITNDTSFKNLEEYKAKVTDFLLQYC